jgi:hypothetical protein
VRFFKSKEEKDQIDAARADFENFILRATNDLPQAVMATAQAFKGAQCSATDGGSVRAAGE